MKRLFATGVCAGGIAAIMTELSGPIGMVSWVFFIAMLSYYASGCGLDGFERSLATNCAGVFWGWLILTLSTIIPGRFSLGISVFLIVIAMCMVAKIHLLSFVSGAFVGCSCFFGTEFNAKGVLYALVIGNVAAFISDLLARKLGDVLEGTGKNEVETNE